MGEALKTGSAFSEIKRGKEQRGLPEPRDEHNLTEVEAKEEWDTRITERLLTYYWKRKRICRDWQQEQEVLEEVDDDEVDQVIAREPAVFNLENESSQDLHKMEKLQRMIQMV